MSYHTEANQHLDTNFTGSNYCIKEVFKALQRKDPYRYSALDRMQVMACVASIGSAVEKSSKDEDLEPEEKNLLDLVSTALRFT